MMRFVKRLLGSRWLKWAVVVIAVGIGAYEIDNEWNEVHQALGQIGLLASFEALLALLVMQFATLRQWQALLAGLGSPLRTTTAGRIFFIGQLGKYIPGSVWPVLTQMELGARANVPRSRSAGASILTMILSLATGLLVAAATLPFAHYSAGYDWVFVFVPVILICLYPRVLNPLLNWLFKLTKRPGLDQPVTFTMLTRALVWSLLAWVANGLQIWILAEKLGAPAGRTVLLALGGYAFAWCVGFVIVIDPAGAGIREVLLVAVALARARRRAGLRRGSSCRARSTPSATCLSRAPRRRPAAGGGATARPTLPREKTWPAVPARGRHPGQLGVGQRPARLGRDRSHRTQAGSSLSEPAWARIAGKARCSASFQSPIGSMPAARHASWPRTLYAGRCAGVGYSAVVIGFGLTRTKLFVPDVDALADSLWPGRKAFAVLHHLPVPWTRGRGVKTSGRARTRLYSPELVA